MRRPVFMTMLAALMLFIGACQNDSPTPSEPAGFSADRGVDYYSSGDCPWEVTPQSTIDTLEWETFEGTIQPGNGGFLMAQSTTWGPGVYFSIQVPPNALPPNVGATDFSISFPKKASYLANQDANCGRGLPLILDMEPHGLLFNEDVTVHVTYMPWMGLRKSDFDDSGSVWSADPMFGLFTLDTVRERPVKGGSYIVTASYKAPHFSRWELGGCVGDDCPPPPE